MIGSELSGRILPATSTSGAVRQSRPNSRITDGVSGQHLAAVIALDQAVKNRIVALRKANPQSSATVPVDLVTASGSGLDPQISVEAAQWQGQRIATARGLPLAQVNKLIDDNTSSPLIGYLGPTVVNVLKLNQALDKLKAN